MVRRRTSSPVSSGPVRRSSPPPRPAAAPAPTPSYSAPPAPVATPMAGATAPKQPGLMAQMAATAGGVAIGSSIGHVVGNMITGSGGSNDNVQPSSAQTPVNSQQPAQNYQNPCEFEYRQFFECSRNASDINLCSAYHDLFKECKTITLFLL
uniref:CHCH domain-containing protein n=1 Tax=Strongyloides stercoralis TaxID=6248 RepID=A0A0K0ED23_STRER